MPKPSQPPKLRIPRNRRKPVDVFWLGPESTDDEGGVTQSMLSNYVVCKERFRVTTVLGLRAFERFNHYIEYGQIWHNLEEIYSSTKTINIDIVDEYRARLHAVYPMQRVEISKWCAVAKVQFPAYVDYWKDQREEKKRKNLFAEMEFRIPYELPSGRTVYLRGKWDGVDLIDKAVWLQENKTKSDTDRIKIEKQLTYDLQTMVYLIALRRGETNLTGDKNVCKKLKGKKIAGVRYNVIRRPLSGGKGSIRRHKATKSQPQETLEHYYGRLDAIIREDPKSFFSRWDVAVDQTDYDRFEKTTLVPLLENLTDDYEWWKWSLENKADQFDGELRHKQFPAHCPRHYRLPYGVNTTLLDSGSSDVDSYLATGSVVGLRRPRTLFPELNEDIYA